MEGLSTVLSFLGILIDTETMECRPPEDKLTDLQLAVVTARGANKLILHQLQWPLVKLNFACRIMPIGRVFNRRLPAATAPSHRIWLFPNKRWIWRFGRPFWNPITAGLCGCPSLCQVLIWSSSQMLLVMVQ